MRGKKIRRTAAPHFHTRSRVRANRKRISRIHTRQGQKTARAREQVSANDTIEKNTIVQSLGESKGSRLRVSPVIYRGREQLNKRMNE